MLLTQEGGSKQSHVVYVSEYAGLDHSVSATAAEHEAALSTLLSVGGVDIEDQAKSQ